MTGRPGQGSAHPVRPTKYRRMRPGSPALAAFDIHGPGTGAGPSARDPALPAFRPTRPDPTRRAGACLPLAVDDSPLGQVVRRDLDGHAVARDDPDEVL